MVLASHRSNSGQAMCRSFRLLVVAATVLVLAQNFAFVSAKGSSTKKSLWLTLTGNAPLVVARGGFSGLLPDSSMYAYNIAQMVSVTDLVMWCDVQLTKDGTGICLPSVKLDNGTSITAVFPEAKTKTYNVNGASMDGYFALDYTMKQLKNVTLTQGIFSRPINFDGSGFQILTPQVLFDKLNPSGLWLNVQNDAFYSQKNLSMSSFILRASKSVILDYLSSPELNFLKGISPKFASSKTQLIFRFMEADKTEPTTDQTYGTLLKNLTLIKSFASGILVPKTYIWPVDTSLYLSPATTLVQDAHKAGLLVFAADFANDYVISYNYSYNPVAEYLQFIDNGDFSVDGVLTDYPVTPSLARDCFAHLGRKATGQANLAVISRNGASGDYPASTDLAYTKAISDGANYIDCNVQTSKDGVPFCSAAVSLVNSTTIAQTKYFEMTKTIPELQSGDGIFSFQLNWKEIQDLTPAISNPYAKEYTLYRNPKLKNAGKIVSLDDFLSLAKNTTSLSGVLIRIENAAYLAEKQGLGVIDVVLNSLNKSGYSNQTAQKIMIQSSDTAVLKAFKGKSYELVYEIAETIRDISDTSVAEIKSVARTVIVNKDSIYPVEHYFTIGKTNVVRKLRKANLTVFGGVFRNEFVSQAYDLYSDPIVEMNSFVQGIDQDGMDRLDGVITDFPKTAASYKRNRCLPMTAKTPSYALPVDPGSLLVLMNPIPPAEAPAPILNDVSDPPLPPVEDSPAPAPSPLSAATGSPKKSDGNRQINACCAWLLSFLAIASSALFLLS